MKNFYIFILAITVVTAFVISCSSSDDDDSTATSSTTYLTPSSCTDNETVSGSITGFNALPLSGTYSLSWYGYSPDGGCIDNSTALGSSGFNITGTATDVSSVKHQLFVTSSSTYTITTRLYSDSSCSTMIGFLSKSVDNITVGDNISFANPPSGYPGYGTKYTEQQSKFCIYGGTTPTTNLWKSWTSGSTFSITERQITDTDGGNTVYNGLITQLDNITGSSETWLYYAGQSSSAYDNHSSSGDTFYNDNVSN